MTRASYASQGKARAAASALGLSGSVADIYTELFVARSQAHGLTIPFIAQQCPSLCALLGNGDPAVAFSELSHRMLELIAQGDDAQAVEALTYSLGLTTDELARTHTDRLNELAGDDRDERTIRRYSDRGLLQVARLIATNWTTQTVPELTVILLRSSPEQLSLMLRTRRQWLIDMHQPTINLWQPDDPAHIHPVKPVWQPEQPTDANGQNNHDGPWRTSSLQQTLTIPLVEHSETALQIVWKGDIWPKFIVNIIGNIEANTIQTETVGNNIIVTITT